MKITSSEKELLLSLLRDLEVSNSRSYSLPEKDHYQILKAKVSICIPAVIKVISNAKIQED